MTEPPIKCVDMCGAAGCWNEEEALDRIWQHLEISNRWRCIDCARALRAAAGVRGPADATIDSLPLTSRGALPKDTSVTIYPVSVQP